jgi:hypothetical protein
MTLADALIDYSSAHMHVSLVCNDEAIYEGIIVQETNNGLWLSIGGNPDRIILFPWTSINRVVLKRRAENIDD